MTRPGSHKRASRESYSAPLGVYGIRRRLRPRDTPRGLVPQCPGSGPGNASRSDTYPAGRCPCKRPGAGPHKRAARRVPNTSGAGLRGFRARRSSYGPPGASVRGLILCDDRRGDAATLADLVPTLLGPGADLRAALAARAAPRTATAPTGRASPARVLCVLPELLAQFLSVHRAHVDLIGGSVKGERNRLRPLDLAVMWKVTHDRHHCLLSHGSQPFRWSFYLLGAKHIPRLLCLTIRAPGIR